MHALSLDRSNPAQAALSLVLTLAALGLLAVVLAYWTWAWLAPTPEPRLPVNAVADNQVGAAGTLFGIAPARAAVAAPTGIAIRLLGVVAAAAGHAGYALLQLDAKPMLAVREGAEFAPGVVLQQVASDHIVLERAGVRETQALPQPSAPMLAPAGAPGADP
jgi:general secretion pathway protein C